jgi:hypothetical protein
MDETDKKVTGHSLMEQMHEPELAQFVPPVKNMTHKRCEKCEHYATIDGGFGYCKRFPPKRVVKKKWFSTRCLIEYPLTEWHRKACGEFKLKKT